MDGPLKCDYCGESINSDRLEPICASCERLLVEADVADEESRVTGAVLL